MLAEQGHTTAVVAIFMSKCATWMSMQLFSTLQDYDTKQRYGDTRHYPFLAAMICTNLVRGVVGRATIVSEAKHNENLLI